MDKNEGQGEVHIDALARRDMQSLQSPDIALGVTAEESRDFLDYWHIIVKRRWEVLICFLAVFCTVAIATFKEKPVYAGRALVEINPEPPNVLNFKEVLQLDTTDVDSYRETQYRILQSRTLAERVVKDLQLYRNPEFYRSQRLFGLIESNPDHIPSASDPQPIDTSSAAFVNSVKHFQASVDISPVWRSNLVEVTFYSYDPRLAARVTNQLVTDYIDQNLQVKWDETMKASDWLQRKLQDLKVNLEKSEDAMQAYAQANNIMFIAEKQNLVNARLEQLQTEYTKAQADRMATEAQASLVRSGRVQDLPGVLSNLLIQNLEEKLAELQRQYSDLTATVKPDYPRAVQLKRQMDTVQANLDRQKKALAQNILDDYKSAVTRENFLAAALDQQKKEVNAVAEKTIAYNILKREVDTNRQLYDGLLQRLKEAQVSAGLKASNIRVVDAADPPKGPVKPQILLNLATGVLLGLALGIGLAFLRDHLDRTLKTPDEIEKLLRLPSLGILPEFGFDRAKGSSAKAITSGAGQESIIRAGGIQTTPQAVEAFRSLRTSVLLSASPIPRTLLITSALPGEGKTTTTLNLGATLASLGSKVLVIDCDMRRPACHKAAGVQNKLGFVQCLASQISLADAIQPVPGVPNLSLIACGPIPPNPAEMLSSPIAADLLRELRSQFEYVLLDSPPILTVADARILSTLTDAVILVARAHQTPYDVVRRARSLLFASGARVLGAALNGVNFHKDGYSYHSYYYRQGYGYGAYGYGYSSSKDAEVDADSSSHAIEKD